MLLVYIRIWDLRFCWAFLVKLYNGICLLFVWVWIFVCIYKFCGIERCRVAQNYYRHALRSLRLIPSCIQEIRSLKLLCRSPWPMFISLTPNLQPAARSDTKPNYIKVIYHISPDQSLQGTVGGLDQRMDERTCVIGWDKTSHNFWMVYRILMCDLCRSSCWFALPSYTGFNVIQDNCWSLGHHDIHKQL